MTTFFKKMFVPLSFYGFIDQRVAIAYCIHKVSAHHLQNEIGEKVFVL